MYTIATGSASASARSGAPSSDGPRPGGGDQIGPDRVRVGCGHLDTFTSTIRHSKGGTMTWVKPKFEIVELCSEVTSYVFQR